jgi:hypothetical protein
MREFYKNTLAILGYKIVIDHKGLICGFGQGDGVSPDFWVHIGGEDSEPYGGDAQRQRGKTHVAFRAKSKQEVNDWYETAL